jgi:hypothetical protein
VVRKKAIIHFYKTTMQAAGEEEDSFWARKGWSEDFKK